MRYVNGGRIDSSDEKKWLESEYKIYSNGDIKETDTYGNNNIKKYEYKLSDDYMKELVKLLENDFDNNFDGSGPDMNWWEINYYNKNKETINSFNGSFIRNEKFMKIVEFLNERSKDNNSNEEYEKYYKVLYKSTYETGSYLKKENNCYEIVNNPRRAEEIFENISHNEYIDIFNAEFFKNNNLVFFDGGVGAKVQKYKISDDKIQFLIYADFPLTRADAEWTFSMFFVPINKNLTDIDIKCEVNPDRIY